MVEINNQRKAFLDMLAWFEWTDNDVRKPEIMVMTSLQAWERFTDYSDHPRKLVTLTQNSNQQAPDATSFSRWWDAFPRQAAWPGKTSPKSQDAVVLAAD